MIHIPVSRWGEPYKSSEADKIVHFATGEPVAEMSRAVAALVPKDMRFAPRARAVLREIPIKELLPKVKKAGELYARGELPCGDGSQTADQFVRMQSATTGLPEHMCRFNMEKNHFVLNEMERILDCLTRGLDLNVLTRGFGMEDRGVPISYQAQSPAPQVLPTPSAVPQPSTYPYDGGPKTPVPLPGADTVDPTFGPRPTVPVQGKLVYLPLQETTGGSTQLQTISLNSTPAQAPAATPRYTYPAYGEQPLPPVTRRQAN